MSPQDSIISNLPASFNNIDSLVRLSTRPQTPYQVLRLLPTDATPAQQDSAIQAWFGEADIHYSDQPDTLHLPGHGIPRDLKEVNLPQYYRENFFSQDSLYHPELNGGRYGIAGDPIPYTIQNDSIITSILIICFLLITMALSRISGFIFQQGKNFFYPKKSDQTLTETGSEVKFQLVFLFITCLIYALLYYFYTNYYITNTFILSSEYALLGIYTGAILVYFLLKAILYSYINITFFDRKKNLHFMGNLLFIASLEGIALFPLVLLLAYFQFSLQNAIYYCLLIVVVAKIATFYKTYIIFFKQKALFLQIILYFCALEMIPLFALWSGLSVIMDILKVNF